MSGTNGRERSVEAALAERRRRRSEIEVGHRQYGTLTSGEAASVCGVAPRTLSKWVDNGALPGWKFPETGDRRVERRDLMAFLATHGMHRALAALRADLGVLLVRCNLAPDLPAWAEPIIAGCPAEAGALFERLVPPWAIVDAQRLGVPEAVSVAAWLSQQPVAPAVLLLTHPDTEGERLGGFDYLPHPAPAEQVAAWLDKTR